MAGRTIQFVGGVFIQTCGAFGTAFLVALRTRMYLKKEMERYGEVEVGLCARGVILFYRFAIWATATSLRKNLPGAVGSRCPCVSGSTPRLYDRDGCSGCFRRDGERPHRRLMARKQSLGEVWVDGNKLQAEWRPARGGRTGPRPPPEENDGMMPGPRMAMKSKHATRQRRDLDFSSRDMMLQAAAAAL